MSDVAPLLFIAMGVFALAYIIISLVNIPEPAAERKTVKYEHSAWSFRHLVLGVVAIFFYVGVEVGIPSQLIFYFSDATEKGAGIAVNGVAIGGAIAAVYWLLMMVGRIFSSFIRGKVSTKAQLVTVSSVAILFVVIAIFLPKEITMTMPAYSVEDGFTMVSGSPVKALFLVLCGLCTSLMWGGIFNLSTEGQIYRAGFRYIHDDGSRWRRHASYPGFHRCCCRLYGKLLACSSYACIYSLLRPRRL